MGEKTVGAGAKWSGCFLNVLWWSIDHDGSSDCDGSIMTQPSDLRIRQITHCHRNQNL